MFPGLAPGTYDITSNRDKRYNCIAWAARDDARWWWPGPNLEEEYWPPGLPRIESLAAFQTMFESLGYSVCQDTELEPGIEKVAVFANTNGAPKHGAQQLTRGRWTSKIGAWEDIEHALHDLEGDEYGSVVVIMKRSSAT